MTVALVSALSCAAVYTALVILTLSRRPFTRESGIVAGACTLTVGWMLSAAFKDVVGGAPVAVLETAQTLAWISFLAYLLFPTLSNRPNMKFRLAMLGTPFVAGVAVLVADVIPAQQLAAHGLTEAQIIGREVLAIMGLLLVENLYRNTAAKQHWNIVPLCIALGGLFAYQLFLYSDALLFGWISDVFAAARPVVDCLIAPFLALTLFRNRGWQLDLRVSQRVVLHSLTLIASGVLLVAIVTVATLLRDSGGEWGRVVQVTTLFGSLLVLATVISSGSAKARLKYLVSRNFFALRYDYRVEWMNFIDVLSVREEGEDLKRRVVQAIANVVDSPGGALWLKDAAGDVGQFVPVTLYNTRVALGTAEPADSAFIQGFRGGRWIQEFHQGKSYAALGDCWLAVPLVVQERVLGFITLNRPRAPVALNWESFELLRALARQAASYVAEQRLGQQLHDSRRFQEYAKRFAFVAHDIKNLAAQLQMIVVNAKRHGDNPDFRADAFLTIENSVSRMNDLLQQLRANQVAEADGIPSIDAVAVIRRVLAARNDDRAPIRMAMECGTALVRIDQDRLSSALTHLLDNAIEASPPDGTIAVTAQSRDGKLVIDIADEGAGMDIEFIHSQLFRPFRSTKSNGYGIGAYQTRDLVRAAGGELEVVSAPGAGTTMRVILPLAKEGAVSTAA
jgi:putative PEP-CTERM system histidine kinase